MNEMTRSKGPPILYMDGVNFSVVDPDRVGSALQDPDRNRQPGHDDPDPANQDRYQFYF
jgi:hypothetical protein